MKQISRDETLVYTLPEFTTVSAIFPIIVLLAIGLAGLLYFFLLKRRPGVVVLGQEIANALQEEEKWLVAGPRHPSPLPAQGYKLVRGEWGLVNPIWSDLDAQLRQLCQQFRDLPDRSGVCQSISSDEFFTLMTFARRGVVFAIRNQDPSLVRDAAVGLAVIDIDRVDWRDMNRALCFVLFGFFKLGLDCNKEIGEAADLAAMEKTREIILSKIGTSKTDARSLCRCAEVTTSHGFGLVDDGLERYEPKTGLFAVATGIASIVDADLYLTDNIEMATDLPDTWLRRADPRALKAALGRVRAGVTIRAKLQPGHHRRPETQKLWIFLVEVDQASAAQQLLEFSRFKDGIDYGMLGVAHDSLFALVIGDSFLQGVKSFEKDDSLNRLFDPILSVLKLHSPSASSN